MLIVLRLLQFLRPKAVSCIARYRVFAQPDPRSTMVCCGDTLTLMMHGFKANAYIIEPKL